MSRLGRAFPGRRLAWGSRWKVIPSSGGRKRDRRTGKERKGKEPSALSETTGASKQRHHVKKDAEHAEKLATIRKGEQPVIAEKTRSPRHNGRITNR